tara:strand:- start:479 stop:700 length:222 start_codon:yes stop_codon:yes gene_type:complete
MPKRLPQKRYEALVRAVWRGTLANYELVQLLEKHGGADPSDDGSGEEIVDTCLLNPDMATQIENCPIEEWGDG